MATKKKKGLPSTDGRTILQEFPLMKASARQHPTEWFAEGRDPWRSLYSPSVLRSIGQSVGITDIEELDRLGVSICHVASSYLMVAKDGAADAGLDLNTSERAKWIEKHLIKPAEKLLEALEDLHQPKLSEWQWPTAKSGWIDMPIIDPRTDRHPSFQNQSKKTIGPNNSLREMGYPSTYRGVWLAELNRLLDWARTQKADLRRPPGSKKPATNFRYELVYDLLLVYEDFFPDRKATRKIGRESLGKSSIQSEFAKFVRAAAKPILGQQNLDHQIQEAIRRQKVAPVHPWYRGLMHLDRRSEQK